MAIIKCKMCGGDIPVESGEKVSTCRYCGLSVTLPNLDSEKKTRLFNKANDYRMNSEFDKAFELYKSIVQDDSGEAEAYWGMLLCEYGIEYVKESATGKRVPTCHRTKKQSIFDSVYYIQATKNASEDQKLIYRDEAESIDRLQQEILSVARQIEPYDVFICYKESDENGDRTNDSVLAQEIYENLTDKGFRTFFARISLEDKIGLNYEPYIYSALNSAKVMVLVTESLENCNSVWVKNEWSRFIKFKKEHPEKIIIPACKNISASDLPAELSRFQGQDMTKIGAIQDLVHSINRYMNANNSVSPQNIVYNTNPNYGNHKSFSPLIISIIAVLVVAVIALIAAVAFLTLRSNYKNNELQVYDAEQTFVSDATNTTETKITKIEPETSESIEKREVSEENSSDTIDNYSNSTSTDNTNQPIKGFQSFYGIWCMATYSETSAIKFAQDMMQYGFAGIVFNSANWSNLGGGNNLYLVSAGTYNTKNEADKYLSQVRNHFPDAYIQFSGHYIESASNYETKPYTYNNNQQQTQIQRSTTATMNILLLPYADSSYYSVDYFRAMPSDQLRIARNEVFARHGRMFNDKNLQKYFDSQIWYVPLYSAEYFDKNLYSTLNKFEKANVDLIKAVEAERK